MTAPRIDRPWHFFAFVRERLDAIADQVLSIRDTLSKVHQVVTSTEMARQAAGPPSPFVCVLVEGENERGSYALGNAASVKGQATIELRTDLALRSGRVIVFCDVSRVDVRGIFLGVDLLTSSPGGSCPVARFKEWPAGVILYVQVTAR